MSTDLLAPYSLGSRHAEEVLALGYPECRRRNLTPGGSGGGFRGQEGVSYGFLVVYLVLPLGQRCLSS